MSDDDKGGPKGPGYPDPEEFRKTLEGMFGKMGKGGFTIPGMSDSPFGQEAKSDEVDVVEPEVDDIFQFDLLKSLTATLPSSATMLVRSFHQTVAVRSVRCSLTFHV